MFTRLMETRVPPCPNNSLKEPVRKFEDTHSMEASFMEYHFNLKLK